MLRVEAGRPCTVMAADTSAARRSVLNAATAISNGPGFLSAADATASGAGGAGTDPPVVAVRSFDGAVARASFVAGAVVRTSFVAGPVATSFRGESLIGRGDGRDDHQYIPSAATGANDAAAAAPRVTAVRWTNVGAGSFRRRAASRTVPGSIACVPRSKAISSERSQMVLTMRGMPLEMAATVRIARGVNCTSGA